MDDFNDGLKPLNQGKAAGILHQMRRGNTLVQGSGQRTKAAQPNCTDYLDYSLCGCVSESILPISDGTPYYVVPCFSFLAKSGQCHLMNILHAANVWVPCKATCGSCEWFNKNPSNSVSDYIDSFE